MREKAIKLYQERVLKMLTGKIDDFYLAGGTALSLFYFQHRLSVDLDFFTPDFRPMRIKEIVESLEKALSKKINLTGQNLEGKTAKMLIYNIHFSSRDTLKIDFVEDVFELMKSTRTVEGIRVLSLEDIYIRKLYAACGAVSGIDAIGRKQILGGRAEAKDFYDLYFLSHTFMKLSKFIEKYGNPIIIEGLVRWFRSYDRMAMVDGVLTLDADRQVDYKKMEAHFKKEIDKIIESQLRDI
ncbi:MAG: nucleotidyl transferase AbiEii/AbiGii toxin family protein [Candidatus Omnitrophota bacterium]|nr:nucleotidyl transferase AbiEii/AbiGii toxin family protein [Candidatus Omnitrophota bacterium]